MTWWKPWTWLRTRAADVAGIRDARERLATARADDSTVDELARMNRRLLRDNGLVADVERALRRRPT